jgi:trk system potassium uptake protein TrkA
MKSVLLIGAGRFGRYIAERLGSFNCHILAVDQNEVRINAILPYVTDAQIGDSTQEAFLRSLGVENFDVCIVTIGNSFQAVLETTYFLKKLGAQKIISRASQDVEEELLLQSGADSVVYPQKQLALWVAMRCMSNAIVACIELTDEIAIFEFKISDEWAGKTVAQLDIRRKYAVNIIAIRSQGKLDLTISPDDVFPKGGTILVAGTLKNVQRGLLRER